MNTPSRRFDILGVVCIFFLILTTAHFVTLQRGHDKGLKPGKLATSIGTHVQELLHTGESKADGTETISTDTISTETISTDAISTEAISTGHNPTYATEATAKSEKGNKENGQHMHVRPTAPTSKDAAVKGCEYPIVVHVTPDAHCTGVLGLYGSIVRNVLSQPDALDKKTCVHLTYVDPKLKTIEEMYKWTPRENPYTHVPDCALIDKLPEYNAIVPVQWQALVPIEKPEIMEAGSPAWVAALNKVHSWAFDLYERILILDADSIILTDMHLIFDESAPHYTITAASDQFNNCGDRSRVNGGMILLRPSRYFHIAATELLYDPNGSCMSGKWQQSEQELLNCICGTGYNFERASRPEFSCMIMPLHNSVWPRNYGCSEANVLPMRSIHFTAATKPWLVKDNELDGRFDYKFWHCVRDATRKGITGDVKKCNVPELEETRMVKETGSGPFNK